MAESSNVNKITAKKLNYISINYVTSKSDNLHRVSEISRLLYFCDNFGKRGQIFMFYFTFVFRKELQLKLRLKQPPLVKSVASLPCEM